MLPLLRIRTGMNQDQTEAGDQGGEDIQILKGIFIIQAAGFPARLFLC